MIGMDCPRNRRHCRHSGPSLGRERAHVLPTALAWSLLLAARRGRRADVPRLRAWLGRLHPRAIRRSAAVALRLGLPRHARAVVRQSLPLRRRLRHGGGAARESVCRSICSRRGGCSAPRSASLGLAITWRIGRRIGGPLAGLIALVLLATCPLYYGHMFMNPKDAPFAVAMALFLLGLVRLLDQYPKPCPTTLFIVGARFRALDRLAHHGGLRRARSARRAGAAVRDRGAHRRHARGGPPHRPASCCADPERRSRLCGDGADLAVGRGRSAQPVPRRRNLLALLREALAASCSTAC